MTRKHVTQQVTVINELARSTDIAGIITTCEQLDEIRYEWTYTDLGALNAVFTVEITDDLNGPWITLDAGLMAMIGSGQDELIITRTIFKYIRPRVTFTAGSANIKVKVKCKTIGA